ncbi:MAG: acyltransferase domain-containing protein [Ruminococcus sp.]|nr:acyltransferase domain-containing protein [Ruminococcus sp.]
MDNFDLEDSLDIAVIGMSARVPKAKNYREFWKNLCEGKDCITRNEELKKPNFIAAYGKLDDIEYFDADFFGIKAAEAMNIDPQQRCLMEGIYQALEDSGYTSDGYKGKIGLYLTSDEHLYIWNYLMRTKGEWLLNYHESELYLDGTFSTFIAYYFNIQGPCAITRYACASSLACLHNAYQGLLNYECDMAIVGGVNIEPEQEGCNYYASTVSQSGYLRPFDENADGLIKASGQGVIILKRIADAYNDHDNIVALVKGTCVNNDGNRKAGFAAPSVQGQTEAISTALSLAEVKPSQVGYFESHGTATVLGDTVELRALKNVFSSSDRKEPLMIGSVKSNIGHTSTASGVINVIKTAMMLKNKKFVPTINHKTPNSEIKAEGCPIKVNTEYRDWKTDDTRIAGISAIGMGGANAIAVLSEYEGEKKKNSAETPQLFIFSAKKKESLDMVIDDMKEFFAENKDTDMEDAAYTLQTGRGSFDEKFFVTAKNASELSDKLSSYSRSLGTNMSDSDIIFVFGGAGTQSDEMCLSLYNSIPEFRKYADECFDIYERSTGVAVKERYINGELQHSEKEEERFMLLFTVEYALAKYWCSLGIKPDCMIGHSFGEYAAACISGIFTLEDAIKLLIERGKLYSEIPEGAMLSVSADREKVEPLLEEGVTISAENGRNRLMLSGTVEAIERFSAKLSEAKINNSRLPVNKAGHCDMVSVISERFRKVLEGVNFSKANIPMIPTCQTIEREKAHITPDYWIKQMETAVEFRKAVREAADKYPNAVFIEISAVNQLNDLVKREVGINKGYVTLASVSRGEFSDDREAFLNTVGKIWSCGITVDWEKLYSSKPYKTALPTYRFSGKPYWRYKKYTVMDKANIVTEDNFHAAAEKNVSDTTITNEMTDTEKAIWSIINEITGFEDFDTETDLYELGMDSLSAVLLVSKIESVLHKKVGMQEIYSSHTVKDMAAMLDTIEEEIIDDNSEEITDKNELEDINALFD